MDIANAVVANPKWSAVATGGGRLKRLLSRNKQSKNAPLKTFYRRQELLARHQRITRDSARSLFLKACTKCSDLSKFRAESEDFRIALPVGVSDSAASPSPTVHFTDEFIVTETPGTRYKTCCFRVFDRWTLQLVSSSTVDCDHFYLPFVDGGIACFNKRGRICLLRLATGKLREVSPCPSPIRQIICIAKLVVVIWGGSGERFVTVYKVLQCRAGRSKIGVVRLAEYRETSDLFSNVIRQIPGAKDLDCVAICPLFERFGEACEYQLRSKSDFSLLHVVTAHARLSLYSKNLFSLDQNFAVVCNMTEECSSIDVVSLGTGDFRKVYTFCVPEEMPRMTQSAVEAVVLTVMGRLLVFYYKECHGGFNAAAIWKLPRDFIETCHRHASERTVGAVASSQCDQIILENPSERVRCYDRIDQFGILRCWIDEQMPQVMHVKMLNSIISE